MTLDDVRNYERKMHEKTNIKVCHEQQEHSPTDPPALDDIEIHEAASVCVFFFVLSHCLSSLIFFTVGCYKPWLSFLILNLFPV